MTEIELEAMVAIHVLAKWEALKALAEAEADFVEKAEVAEASIQKWLAARTPGSPLLIANSPAPAITGFMAQLAGLT